ncbi:MAG: hypothetical protein ACU83O_06860, partial [Gammaproteobacteria bacterium]
MPWPLQIFVCRERKGRLYALRSLRFAVKPAAAALAVFAGATVQATDIEPRAYSNIPVDFNFFITSYAYTSGSASFAPSIPIKNGDLEIHSAILAYA